MIGEKEATKIGEYVDWYNPPRRPEPEEIPNHSQYGSSELGTEEMFFKDALKSFTPEDRQLFDATLIDVLRNETGQHGIVYETSYMTSASGHSNDAFTTLTRYYLPIKEETCIKLLSHIRRLTFDHHVQIEAVRQIKELGIDEPRLSRLRHLMHEEVAKLVTTLLKAIELDPETVASQRQAVYEKVRSQMEANRKK